MIKLFPNIRQKILKQGKDSNYRKYAIGQIVLEALNKTNLCPNRDKIWVATINNELNSRAFRYEILI
jgi:hypothetical protein